MSGDVGDAKLIRKFGDVPDDRAPCEPRLTRERVLEEEAQHLPRCVRPARIGVGAGGTTSRPGVSNARRWHARPDRQGWCGCRRAHAAVVRRSPLPSNLPPWRTARQSSRRCSDAHRGVAVAMEDDGRHWRSAIRNFRPASLPHGDERGGKIACPQQARPEWISTAAYRSAWVAAMMAAAAPPAGLFQG
jgi:hypothetical protein